MTTMPVTLSGGERELLRSAIIAWQNHMLSTIQTPAVSIGLELSAEWSDHADVAHDLSEQIARDRLKQGPVRYEVSELELEVLYSALMALSAVLDKLIWNANAVMMMDVIGRVAAAHSMAVDLKRRVETAQRRLKREQ